ncbi:cytochrome P450 [Streptomyces sp. M19]
MEKAGPPADLVASFALPLPSLVICELLGVPYEDHDFFQRSSAIALNSRSSPEVALAASQELIDYLGDLVEAKAADPADDLLSRLATEQLVTGRSTKDECAKEARLLLVAGHETTANMTALGICALLQHPDQLAVVRDGDPARVANAVEELLRYLSVVHVGRRRVATADITVGDQVIKEGDGIIFATDLGNRDPEVFADPDRLDVDRQARRHVAFGSGPHQCLGQNLARAELQLAYPPCFGASRTAAGQAPGGAVLPQRDGRLRRPRAARQLVATPASAGNHTGLNWQPHRSPPALRARAHTAADPEGF